MNEPVPRNHDPRVDAYIARHPAFAPVLSYLRDLIHEVCPDVQETIKWGMPAFDHHGPVCNVAAFKAHCSFSLWKGELILPAAPDGDAAREGMGQFGRITSLADLPPKATLRKYLKQAIQLNLEGVKVPSRAGGTRKPPAAVPDNFAGALRRNAAAQSHFDAFSVTKRRDYIEWITEAKQAATREKRLLQAIEWIAEGKSRNWKYERC